MLRHNRGYRRLLAASTVSNLGDGIGLIAYPWLASAITRNPLLIALIAIAQRIPWLVFALPAGVITDRVNRRRLMVTMDLLRAALTVVVGFAVLARQGDLPDPSDLADAEYSSTSLYILVVVATLLLGCAEVLRDNSAQTFLPSIIDKEDLESANGALGSAEIVANSFVGPPLGSALLIVGFSLPFFVDAATFAVAAALVAAVPGSFAPAPRITQTHWTADLKEGVRWLWSHDLLRTLAIALGFLNLLSTMTVATLVLFAQEVLNTSSTEFAVLGTGQAVGAVIGGLLGARVTARLGSGPVLWSTILVGGVTSAISGLTSTWTVVWVMMAVSTVTAMLWNVLTVSLRQTVIPDELLGRVNSVYRFFGWGMMPIGALAAGLLVAVADVYASREFALRLPWLIAAACHVVLFVLVRKKLTTTNIEAARTHAQQLRAAAGDESD